MIEFPDGYLLLVSILYPIACYYNVDENNNKRSQRKGLSDKDSRERLDIPAFPNWVFSISRVILSLAESLPRIIA